MIVSIRESKARLSELVAKASQGEDVLITIRGKPAVRIVPVSATSEKPDTAAWIHERRQQLASQDLQSCNDSSADILSNLREERW